MSPLTRLGNTETLKLVKGLVPPTDDEACSQSKNGLRCTRETNHPGHHVAHRKSDGTPLAYWPREEVTTS